uniref:Uncharacterized protein n=1 Tax=Palpitomonas bilix TaxID=652834 RepID=A0A7S3G6P4_9EUKA
MAEMWEKKGRRDGERGYGRREGPKYARKRVEAEDGGNDGGWERAERLHSDEGESPPPQITRRAPIPTRSSDDDPLPRQDNPHRDYLILKDGAAEREEKGGEGKEGDGKEEDEVKEVSEEGQGDEEKGKGKEENEEGAMGESEGGSIVDMNDTVVLDDLPPLEEFDIREALGGADKHGIVPQPEGFPHPTAFITSTAENPAPRFNTGGSSRLDIKSLTNDDKMKVAAFRRRVQSAISEKSIEIMEKQYKDGSLNPPSLFQEELSKRLWDLYILRKELVQAPRQWGLQGHAKGKRTA